MDCKEVTWIIICLIWIGCCFIPSSEAYDDNLFSDSLVIVQNTNETFQSRLAAFGPGLEEGLEGIVIPIEEVDKDNKYGCKMVDEEKIKAKAKEYKVDISKDGYIAMIMRGNCTFSQKVRNMQNSGAKGVIVGNDHGDIHLITLWWW